MQTQAVIIQCHNNPEQVNEIISFACSGYDFYVHIDKKSDIKDKIVKRDNVFFVQDEDRIDVRWGDFSQVGATLALLKMVKDSRKEYGYVHLISGACFWAMNPKKILEQLNGDDKQYIECRALPEETTWTWGGLCRFMVSYPKWMIVRPTDNQFKRFCRIAWQEFIMRTKIFRRKKLPVKRFCGGSSWWSVTGELANWMFDYVCNHPEYNKPFIHGILVDEVYFSTLAKYSPFADKITNDHKRYMDWISTDGSGGPKKLDQTDIDNILNSGKFFARKIIDKDTVIELKDRLLS